MAVIAGFLDEPGYLATATPQTRYRPLAANDMATPRQTNRRHNGSLGMDEAGRNRNLRLGTEDGRRCRRENPEFAVPIASEESSAARLGRPTPHRAAAPGVAQSAASSGEYIIPGRPLARTEYDETRVRRLQDPESSVRMSEGCKAAKSLAKVIKAGDKYFEVRNSVAHMDLRVVG